MRCIPVLATCVGSAYYVCMQYTIRNVSAALDRLLRRRARAGGTSLNQAALEALARGAGLSEERIRNRDLGDLACTWKRDRRFDEAIRQQDTIDESLWR